MTEMKWTENIGLYAEEIGHQIIGELIRYPKGETVEGFRLYIDEAGNRYFTGGYSVFIVTTGGVVV